jgi:hypothetical protein
LFRSLSHRSELTLNDPKLGVSDFKIKTLIHNDLA